MKVNKIFIVKLAQSMHFSPMMLEIASVSSVITSALVKIECAWYSFYTRESLLTLKETCTKFGELILAAMV